MQPIEIMLATAEKQVVLRATERIALPERGVPMGNFGAAAITPDESWITVGENMWNYGSYHPTSKGAEGRCWSAGSTGPARTNWPPKAKPQNNLNSNDCSAHRPPPNATYFALGFGEPQALAAGSCGNTWLGFTGG